MLSELKIILFPKDGPLLTDLLKIHPAKKPLSEK
jgi:hypothetical protein